MFALPLQTGIRASELEDLLLEELDNDNQTATRRQGKGLKTVVKVLNAYLEVRGPALSNNVFIYRHKMVSKDLVRLRIKAAGKRALALNPVEGGVYVTPHMLRNTFATQLLYSGCNITSIPMLLGHKRLNTTLVYARVHNDTLKRDFFTAMAKLRVMKMNQPPTR